MSVPILVRDDDLNATTDPAVIERIYAPLLDAGIPIGFATIPSAALDTRAPDGQRERWLHRDVADSPALALMTDQTPIARWLRKNEGRVDVLLHGLTHRRGVDGTEFGALGEAQAHHRITQGIDILQRACGRRPAGFVPPWDRASRGTLQAIDATLPFVSLGWVSMKTLPLRAWWAHRMERAQRREVIPLRKSWVLRHRGGHIGGHTNPADVPSLIDAASEGARLAVIVLHHWMFDLGNRVHPVVTALADALRGRNVINARQVAGVLA